MGGGSFDDCSDCNANSWKECAISVVAVLAVAGLAVGSVLAYDRCRELCAKCQAILDARSQAAAGVPLATLPADPPVDRQPERTEPPAMHPSRPGYGAALSIF